jgi:hypothetical protein
MCTLYFMATTITIGTQVTHNDDCPPALRGCQGRLIGIDAAGIASVEVERMNLSGRGTNRPGEKSVVRVPAAYLMPLADVLAELYRQSQSNR